MSIATLTHAFRRSVGQGRNRSIAAFFVTSLSGRGLGIVCQLVQVPLALRYLGKEAFGVWVTLGSISYLISFSDFGIGMGAQNQMTEALGTGDRPRARRLFTTTLVFLCAVGGVLALVGVPVFLRLPLGFPVQAPGPGAHRRGAARDHAFPRACVRQHPARPGPGGSLTPPSRPGSTT